MNSQVCLQAQHKIPPQSHILLNHFLHSFSLTGASLFRSLSVPLRCTSRCILRCTLNGTIKRTSNIFIVVLSAVSCASQGALKSAPLPSRFNGPAFAFVCTFAWTFKRIFKCALYTLSCGISNKSFWRAICEFVVYFSTLKCTMIFTHICITYSAGVAIHAGLK